jgi:hypothetical protein
MTSQTLQNAASVAAGTQHPHDNGTGGAPVVPMANVGSTPTMPMDARALKSIIFAAQNKKFRSKKVDFFGATIEIRQPSLVKMLSLKIDEDDKRAAGTFILMNYAYAPDTGEQLFQDVDQDSLCSMPYGESFARVMEAFQEVTGTTIKEAQKN